MAVTEQEYVYQYRAPSSAVRDSASTALRVATSGLAADSGAAAHPYFFQGALKRPRAVALALKELAQLANTRFFTPMTAQRKAEILDPIVTSGGELLRFEGFSACCGAYARVDLTREVYDGLLVGQGTTNVDFNAAMRGALGQIRDNEAVSLAVGADEVTLLRGAEQVVERKVKLPVRWIKGLVETQAYQARMRPALQIGRAEAVRFIQGIRPTPQGAAWLGQSGSTLRAMQAPARNAVAAGGLDRLRVIKPFAPYIQGLRIYAHPEEAATAWEFDLGGLSFTLVLSPALDRGFSGEGQVLETLAQGIDEDLLDQVRASLKWQAELRPGEFAANWDLDEQAIGNALAVLASRGLVGFDLARMAYFHRELPFDLEAVETLQPRLRAARKLVAAGGVKLVQSTADETEYSVPGTGVTHRVRLNATLNKCSCEWFAKNQGLRGPCKHILAAMITQGAEIPSEEV